MKIPLPIVFLGVIVSGALCGGGVWFHDSADKTQRVQVQQASLQLNAAQAAISALEQEWPVERMTLAKTKAEQFRASVLSEDEWAQFAVDCGKDLPGARIVLRPAPPRASQPDGSKRVRVVVSLDGIKSDQAMIEKITEILTRLDQRVGGCQRVVLYLPQGSAAATGLPLGVFDVGSEAVFEFNLRTS